MPNVSQPVLSIIIPTYNRREILTETLSRLFASLPAGVEVIVIDDGSTDNTETHVRARFPRATFIRTSERQGPSCARNVGLAQARGRNFMPLDSDCFAVPETLEWLVKRLECEREAKMVFACRSLPAFTRSVDPGRGGPYTFKDILLKRCGEVVPVLSVALLARHGLSYPPLFAGGEPLLALELSRLEDLEFVDMVLIEYRTDLPMRISSPEYQLLHALEIAQVFEAYLPFLEDHEDREIRAEEARTLEKTGVYLSLAGHPRQARSYLQRSIGKGRALSVGFWLLSFLPRKVSRSLFLVARSAQSILRDILKRP